jgi:hypothetical protein
MNGWKALQAAGALLVLGMFVMGTVGTYNATLYYTWGVLGVVGLLVFLGARRIDERKHYRRR